MNRCALLLALALAGCSTTAAPLATSSRLHGPAAATMVRMERLPAVKAGDDAKVLLGQCRAHDGEAMDKLEPLQEYARRVTQSRQ